MSARHFVRGPFGAEVWVDIDVDMDQRTFDAMVERGELTVLDKPKAPATRATKK